MKNIQLKHVDEQDSTLKFMTMLAHQVNSPLSCILAGAELSICFAHDETAVKKHCANILKCADMIRDLNYKILKIGKSCNLQTELVDLTGLIDRCTDTFKDLFEISHVLVEKQYNVSSVSIRCNAFGLEQVFNNLITNALDAMADAAFKQISITVTRHPDAEMVSVWITDTGSGISDEVLPRIFLPNFTTKHNGNGLGLAICKHIVELHKGNVEIISRQGFGASFGIHLPLEIVS